jgi:hypothetical protein
MPVELSAEVGRINSSFVHELLDAHDSSLFERLQLDPLVLGYS